MTGLDPQGIRNLKTTIVEQAKSGTAIIISSHLLAMVEDICSHVMILERGTRKFFGQIDDLKQQFGQTDEEVNSLEDIYFATMEMLDPVAEQLAGESMPDNAASGV